MIHLPALARVCEDCLQLRGQRFDHGVYHCGDAELLLRVDIGAILRIDSTWPLCEMLCTFYEYRLERFYQCEVVYALYHVYSHSPTGPRSCMLNVYAPSITADM
jgi:hypothetical protein